jgi:translation initiation factor 2B subunit (eIF-2B alpha/beta/delta family)
MALQKEDLQTLQLAFGEHDQPEQRAISMVMSVLEGTSACTTAMLALCSDLVDRWNRSADLLDRVQAGVQSLKVTADGHASVVNLTRDMAANVMDALGESADAAREGLDERRPEMVQKMEALVSVLSGRTTSAQDESDDALEEWAGTLVGQQDELRALVPIAAAESEGMDAVMAAARTATAEGFTALHQRLDAVGKSAETQLDFADQQVIAPALNAWTVAVDDLPDAVEKKVTALLAELTPPAEEAGALLAQRGAALQELAGDVSAAAAAAVRELRELRERIAAGLERLVEERTPLADIVDQCQVTARELGEPW